MTTTMPSLLDGMAPAPPAPVAKRAPLRERLRERFLGTPERRRKSIVRGRWIGGVALLGAVAGAYLALRPTPMPDYEDDPLDEVFGYTLLSDEFNKLPVEKRLELVGTVFKRIQSMSSGDSGMMAAFAAGIMGKAREQMEENASRLMIDLWDKYSLEYDRVPAEERERFIDSTVVQLMRTTEVLSGQANPRSDEEILADAKEQSRRDQARLSDPKRAPGSREFAGMFIFMDRTIGARASGGERARGQALMRDMTRRLRGQDIRTGKPLDGGG